MATANLSDFFRRLTRGMAAYTLDCHSDQQLVERALAGSEEVAFQAIIHRHGPMVFRVCWRVLRHAQDAEDAFQATFLVLAQKLHRLRNHASLASWLHGIAHQVALKSKTLSGTRRRREQQASRSETLPRDDGMWGTLLSALDLELRQLPESLRQPLILCYLQGRTQDESACQLGWSKSTLRRRLEEGRTALRYRLKACGLALPAGLSAVFLSDCVAQASPAWGLIAATVDAGMKVVSGQSPTICGVSAKVAILTKGWSIMSTKNLILALAFLPVTCAIGMYIYAANGRTQTAFFGDRIHQTPANGVAGEPGKKDTQRDKASGNKPFEINDELNDKDAIDPKTNGPYKKYLFKFLVDKNYVIELIGHKVGWRLHLLGGNGGDLSSDWFTLATRTSKSRILFSPKETVEYPILVSFLGGKANYGKFTLKVRDHSIKNQAKPYIVGEGFQITDEFGIDDSTEFGKIYSVELKAGDRYTVKLVGKDVDLLNILDAKHKRLFSRSRLMGHPKFSTKQIEFKAENDGVYHILIGPRFAELGGRTGDFTLSITKTVSDTPERGPFEINDAANHPQ